MNLLAERRHRVNVDLNFELIKKGQNGYGWLSVNRYGAVCLNAMHVLFGDVDETVDEEEGRAPTKLFTEEQALKWATRVVADWNMAFRVYRTFAGVRLIEVSQLHRPQSTDSLAVLEELGCDTAYIKLTKKQEVYRARLTPKPWRAVAREVGFQWKDNDLATYLENPKWRIAELITVLGTPKPNPEIDFIVELHDFFCCRGEGEFA